MISQGVKQATVPADILDATSANGKDPINALKKAGFDDIEQTAASDDDYSMDVPQGALLSITERWWMEKSPNWDIMSENPNKPQNSNIVSDRQLVVIYCLSLITF